MKRKRGLWAAALLLGSIIVLTNAFQVVVVDGDSMMPALHNGQIVVAVRASAGLRRGDIVLIRRNREILIKRIVYLPAQLLHPLDRPLFRHAAEYFEVGNTPDTLRVPPGRFVVMGDNRSNSDDSRRFGPVARRDIVGRVLGALPFP